MRDEALLDLVFTNAEEMAEDIKIRGSMGRSSHILVDFMSLRNEPSKEWSQDPDLWKSKLQAA